MIFHCQRMPREWAQRLRASVLLAFALLAMTPLGIASADTLVWTERSSGELTTLSYGSLDPDENPLLLLSCFNDMEVAILDVHQQIDGAAPGDAIAIELSSAKGRASVQGEVARNQETGTNFGEASDIKVKPILAVLHDPGPLTLAIGKSSTPLSDAGREEAASEFGKDCKLD